MGLKCGGYQYGGSGLYEGLRDGVHLRIIRRLYLMWMVWGVENRFNMLVKANKKGFGGDEELSRWIIKRRKASAAVIQ